MDLNSEIENRFYLDGRPLKEIPQKDRIVLNGEIHCRNFLIRWFGNMLQQFSIDGEFSPRFPADPYNNVELNLVQLKSILLDLFDNMEDYDLDEVSESLLSSLVIGLENKEIKCKNDLKDFYLDFLTEEWIGSIEENYWTQI